MNRHLCQIELTYHCDQNCTYCYKKHPAFYGVGDLLSPSQWVTLARTMDTKVFNACLISGGEPSCNMNLLLSVLQELPSSLAQVSILTNGGGLDYKTICQLKQARDDITFQISLDGVTQEAHELKRQTPHSWEKALKCSLILNKLGVRYSFSTVVSSHNLLQVPYIIKAAYAMGASQIHLAEELGWEPSMSGFSPILSAVERRILERFVSNAQHEWACLLDCYLTPSYDEYLELLLEANWAGLLIRPDGSYNVDCFLPVAYEPGYPDRLPAEAMTDAFRDGKLFDDASQYIRKARVKFGRQEETAHQEPQSSDFHELCRCLMGLAVGEWRCVPNESLIYQSTANNIEINKQMEIVVDGIMKSQKVSGISEHLEHLWNISFDTAFLDVLVGIQQLIDGRFVHWEWG